MRIADRLAQPMVCAFLFVLAFLYRGWLMALGPFARLESEILAIPGAFVPEVEFGKSGAEILASIDLFGNELRARYLEFQFFDVPFLLGNGLFLSSLVLLLTRRISSAGSRLRWLVVLPVMASGLDLLEDAALFAVVAAHPDGSRGLASFAGVLTSTKLVSVMATLGTIAVCAVRLVISGRRGRSGTAAATV